MFIGCRDTRRQLSATEKVVKCKLDYTARFPGLTPDTVLCSFADAVRLAEENDGDASVADLKVRAVTFIAGSTFYVGTERDGVPASLPKPG